MPFPSPKAFLRLDPAADVHWARLAIGLWVIVLLAIAGYSIHAVDQAQARGTPDRVAHSVSPVYWKAAHQWWQGTDMYGSKEPTQEGRHGFLYLPQAATLFTPLAYLPLTLAEVSWRFLNIAGVAYALWRVCGVFGGERRRLWFGLGSFLALSPTLLSSQNGQCNLLILATMALGTVEMIGRRWWRAAAWLALGLAFKPHVLVLILLVLVLQPPMRLRLLVALAAVAALPWLNPDWNYVWQEHISFAQKMRVAGKPPPGTEQDLVTLFHTLGITLSDQAWTIIRLAGAALVSLLALLATLRFERAVAIFFTFSLAILYIMIFNPRTEGPTHAMMAITLATFTLAELTRRPGPLAWALVAACVLLGMSHNLIHPTNRWMQPVLELWFAAYISWNILSRRPVLTARSDGEPSQPAAPASNCSSVELAESAR